MPDKTRPPRPTAQEYREELDRNLPSAPGTVTKHEVKERYGKVDSITFRVYPREDGAGGKGRS